ncbi:Uncharacterised protein [Mycobacteroides abscessus subsp. abscessus]|nr:Uncharacterised protein [Mycobacteroides abscessus subsp. abscessus]
MMMMTAIVKSSTRFILLSPASSKSADSGAAPETYTRSPGGGGVRCRASCTVLRSAMVDSLAADSPISPTRRTIT